MQPTSFRTYTAPTQPNASVPITDDMNTARRVLVRVSGGAVGDTVLFSPDPNELINVSLVAGAVVSSGAAEVPQGASDVFVLAPRQKLHALANGAVTATMRVSVSVSEALPVTLDRNTN